MINHLEVIELIKEASSLIMSHYNQKVDVRYKHDNSAVSEVDEKSHHLILERLSKLTPHFPVISEECQDHECVDLEQLCDFWLIDPIDGTEGFLKANDNFTVNIAFMENKRPKYGYIIIPCLGEVYYNDDDHAYCIDASGAKKIITTRAVPEKGYDALMSSKVKQRTIDQLSALNIHSITKIGSALKFCHIAAGKADLYYRHGTTMEWDTAAGDAILTKAGGSVNNPDGTIFSYCKAGFKNGPFVATGGKENLVIPWS
jgi:3'(2'), 5'-bisphosphate nucleotidase